MWDKILLLLGDRFENLILFFGFLLLSSSFAKFDGTSKYPSFPNEPVITLLVIGGIIFIFGILLHMPFEKSNFLGLKKIEKNGINFNFNNLKVCVKTERLENIISNDENAGIVLPVNTTFIDECKTDTKSVMGSVLLKFHPDKIQNIQNDILKILGENGIKEINGHYPIGTAIILPEIYDKPCKIILVSSTIKSNEGIRSSPCIISSCVEKVFQITSDKRIKKLYMPVLGSGHGGVNLVDSIVTIIITLKFLSNSYHHIKELEVLFLKEHLREIIRNLKILKIYNN